MPHLLGSVVTLLVVVAVVPMMGVVAAQEDTPTPTVNGTEGHHVDPDETNEDGDLPSVQTALERRLAEQLADSAIQLSQGEYELANDVVGEEYQDRYGEYVDVVGETGEEDRVEEFRTARERQQALASSVQQYNETRQAYREAKRNGNETRARRLARELERLSENISEYSEGVTESYEDIENRTDVDMTAATESVNTTAETITSRQAEIRDAEFVDTTLSVTPLQYRVAFTDPLVAEGRLTAENGTALANRSVVLTVRNDTVTTRTDANGEFSMSYRPVTVRPGPTNATLRYIPDDASVYLGTQTRTAIDIEQETANVTIASASDSAGFNEGVGVSGQVDVAGVGVPNVTVVLSMDGERFGRTTTSHDGTFRVAGRLPASAAAGEQTIRLTVPLDDRAVTRSTGAHPMTVAETATELTVEADPTTSSVRVTGTLQTTDGEVVLDQKVEIRRDGEVVATATTGRGGAYEATVPGEAGEEYRLAVAYADSSTNLEDTAASTTVTLPEEGVGELLMKAVAKSPALLGGLVLLLGLLGGGVWWTRNDGVQTSDEALWTRDGDESATEPPTTGGPAEAETRASVDEQLAAARTSLDEDPDAAVEQAYTAVRRRLRAEGIGSDDTTHWEFFRACADANVESIDKLETLTVLYEQAAFGPTGVAQSDAEAALEASDELI